MELRRDLRYAILVGGSLAVTGLAFLAPWARARGLAVADFLYLFFAPVCHQIPGRSFHCLAHPLAVCHRCFGLYTGFVAGLLLMPYLHRLRRALIARPRWILLFFAPMAVDVALLGWNTWWSRYATGFVAAFPVGLFVWMAFDQLYRQFAASRSQPTQRTRHEWSQAQ